jgi:hypothetical protein
MKTRTIAATVALCALIPAVSSANAAPSAYKGYCLVPMAGNAPGTDVTINKGESKEIYKTDELTYSVSYGDDLFGENILQLKIYNSTTKHQSLSVVGVEQDFPYRIDLVKEGAPAGLSCITKK